MLGYLRAQRAPDPEDVAGEVFLQVVRDLPGFSGDEAGFRAWVFTIAHRRLVDARRRVSRRPAEPTPSDELEATMPPVATEPEALAALGTEEVLALLDRLTEDQREVLVLRLVAGLTGPEIAEVTGRDLEAVKALARRGLLRLRAIVTGRARSAHPDESAPPEATPER